MAQLVYLSPGEQMPKANDDERWLIVEANDDGRIFGSGCWRHFCPHSGTGGPDLVMSHPAAHIHSIAGDAAVPAGGVRLVCMSASGAETMLKTFRGHLIDGTVIREKLRPDRTFW